ncbi:MAG: Gfo/Idh/MocA family oxidoreductase [Bacteroidales bacterium]|jgi:UDP-N-acetyl-2-amino-2-deoxyglucuronate dehydrogenase|nr:Gfo/Idh/MocA family oxidoreductase [Bacteroidales bacterium]
MQSTPLRFGIIGTGAIARVHAQCLKQLSNAKLVAMSSSSAERAKAAEKTFKVPVYAHYHELIQHSGIDAVVICTQSGAHLEPSLEAAKAGKHVLCEKPLEISLARADEMIASCHKGHVKLSCVFQNRFSPDYSEAKDAVQKGWLGKLLMGNASIHWYRSPAYYADSPWRGTLGGDGGAALINQGIHTIDLLLDLMGDAKSVFGKTKTNVHHIEGEDTASALVSFKNGALGTITAGTSLYPGYAERLEIFGEKGSLLLEAGKITAWNIQGHHRTKSQYKELKPSGASDPMAIGNTLHQKQLEDFISSIQHDTKPIIDGKEGRKALALITGIYESAKLGQEIDL